MKSIVLLSTSLLFFSACSQEQETTSKSTKAVEVQEVKQELTQVKKAKDKIKVLQRIDSGGYSYVEVSSNNEVYWIAGVQTDVVKGDFIEYDKQMVMPSFTSNTLQRTFKNLVFTSAIYKEGSKTEITIQADPHPVAIQKISIEKAKSGTSVEDLFTQRETLKGKSVLFNAQVVKVTKDVMDKDWIHLQDGSGRQGTHDIIATAKNTQVQVGDRVQVQGTLHTDLNLGSGYVYLAIVQEASFKSL